MQAVILTFGNMHIRFCPVLEFQTCEIVSSYPRTAKKLAWGLLKKCNLQKTQQTQQDNKKYMFMRLLPDVQSLKIYDSNVPKSRKWTFYFLSVIYSTIMPLQIDQLQTEQLYGI